MRLDLKALWDRVEKYVIIAAIAIYIALDTFSIFIPAMNGWVTERGYLILLSAIVAALSLRINEKKPESITRSKKIVRDLVTLLEKEKQYDHVYILAVNGYQYYNAFKDSGVKVKEMNLLLRKTEDIASICLPKYDTDKKMLAESSQNIIRDFNALQENGRIETLNISFYDFDTTMHFMVLDNKHLFFGLLIPKKKISWNRSTYLVYY